MNFDTLQALDKLKLAIDNREYEGQMKDAPWQDYDVMVCQREDESVRHWRMTPPKDVHQFQQQGPRRRVVATRYASELAWLFGELKAIHAHEIELHTYHDFYAELADLASLYIEKNKSGVTATRLLEAMLDRVRRIYH